MKNYTIELTEAEDKALSHATLSQQEWIDNAVHERCRVATEKIVKITVEKCLENNIQIPNSKEEMVTLAFNQSWVQSAADLQEQQTETP